MCNAWASPWTSLIWRHPLLILVGDGWLLAMGSVPGIVALLPDCFAGEVALTSLTWACPATARCAKATSSTLPSPIGLSIRFLRSQIEAIVLGPSLLALRPSRWSTALVDDEPCCKQHGMR